MATVTLGTATAHAFLNTPFIPGIPALFDGTVGDFTTGTHSFTLNAGSVITVTGGRTDIDMMPIGEGPEDRTLTHLMGFATTGTSQWTLNINGVIAASAMFPQVGGAVAGSMGLMLANGANPTGLTTVNLGTDGAIYGNLSGIFSLTAITTTNLGVIEGGVYGINLPGFFGDVPFGIKTVGDNFDVNYYQSILLAETNFQNANLNILTRTSTITNAAGAEIVGSDYGVLNGGESNLVVANEGLIEGGNLQTLTTITYIAGEPQPDPDVITYITGAVVSGGRLTLTNSADGTIYGSVLAGWLGSSVVSSGNIYGTIICSPDGFYVDDVTGRVDVNRDGDTTDAGDLLFSNPALVGLTVVNSGLIYGYQATDVITHIDEFGDAAVDEFGDPIDDVQIQSAIIGSYVRDVVTNTTEGLINGGIYLGAGSDSISNAGRINGDFDLSDGNDVLTQTETGVLTGYLDKSANNQRDNFIFGLGDDTLTAAGTINGTVQFGAGNDAATVSGQLQGDLFADWAFDLEGSFVADSLLSGDGDDVITTASTAIIFGGVYLGFGSNTLTNGGEINGELSFMPDMGGLIEGAVIARDGNDTLTNTITGLIEGAMDLGAGNNRITNQGQILTYNNDPDADPLIATGGGNDLLTNAGIIGASWPLFDDGRTTTANLFFDRGRLDVSTVINLGGGADTLTNTGHIHGNIDMGDGGDVLTGGNFNEVVIESAGADRYSLGAGADAVIIAAGDTSVDTLDGGLGLDLLDFSTSSPITGHRIDLGAGRVSYDMDSLIDSISGTGAANDVITGFEQVVGSSGNDFILGSNAAESLAGGAGDDYIRGGGGRDVMLGNAGADQFVFTAATDSGTTRSTRDVIRDFGNVNDLGVRMDADRLVFLFDSNTAQAGVQNSFVFAGMDVDFSGTAGSIRAYFAGGSTLIEVDTNGDYRADFVVELQGNIGVRGTDFLFT